MNVDRHTQKNDRSFFMKMGQIEHRLESTYEDCHQTACGSVNVDVITVELAAQQGERQRIAQELHDTLLQGFTGIALKLDALTMGLPRTLSNTRQNLEEVLEQMDYYL